MKDLKICVFGAGAVGGHLAGRLAEGGLTPSLIVRGAHLSAIRAHGLTLELKDRTLHSTPRATDDPNELGQQDAIFVTVKAPALPSVAGHIAPLLREDTTVIFVLNGIPWWYFDGSADPLEGSRLPRIDPNDAIRQAVGVHRSVGAVAYTACSLISPGVIQAENAKNTLVMGRPDGGEEARLHVVAELLKSGGMEARITTRIRDEIWGKLPMNLVGGSLGILSASAMRDALDEPVVRHAAESMMHEAELVARALGCDCGDLAAKLAKLAQSGHKQSILQDLEARRTMEFESMLQAPLDIAHALGIQTPALDLMVGLASRRARAAGLYRVSAEPQLCKPVAGTTPTRK